MSNLLKKLASATMRQCLFAVVFCVGAWPAFAQCPTVPTACPSPIYAGLQVFANKAVPGLSNAFGVYVTLPQTDGNRVEIQRDPFFSYAGTRANFVVQNTDAETLGSGGQAPSAVFSFQSTANGVVNSATPQSFSFWTGLFTTFDKYGDGSGQANTVTCQIHAVGPGGYNECGAFQGNLTNVASVLGNLSALEVLLADSPDLGVTKPGPTQMFEITCRLAKFNTSRTLRTGCMQASSEGTTGPDSIISITPGQGVFQAGFDLSQGVFASGAAMYIPNNANISSQNHAGSGAFPMIGGEPTDITFVRPLSNTAFVQVEDFQGAPVLRAANYGGVLAVNFVTIVNEPVGTGALLGTSNVAGAGAVPLVVSPQGSAPVEITTSLGIGTVPTHPLDVSGVINTSTVYQIGGTQVLSVASGNFVIGSGSALATNATTGFPAVPTMAGMPTGITGAAGKAAVVIDTTDDKLCWSVGGGTWKCVVGS